MNLEIKNKDWLRAILSGSMLVPLWISVTLDHMMMFVVFLISIIIILVLFSYTIIHDWYVYGKIRMYILLNKYVKLPSENIWYLSFIKNKSVIFIAQKLSKSIHSNIWSAGVAMDPYLESTKNLGRTILVFVLGCPVIVLLWIYFEQPIILIVIITFPIILIWPKIKLVILASERKTRIDDEVAFFSIYAWILQTIGGSLVDIISGIRGAKLLPHMEKEADMMSRDIGFFPENPLDVVNKRSLEHPNQMLRDLFVGYVSIYKDGGDLVNYLEKTTENLFSQLKFKFHRYEEQAKNLAILANALFSMLPIFLVAGMFIMTVNTLSSLITLMFIMMPVMGAIVYVLVNSIQPKFADDVKFNLFAIPIGISGAVFGYFVLEQLWAAITLGMLFLTCANTLLVFGTTMEIKSTNTALGSFLRDITESRKVGNPISVAIHRLAKNRKYNQLFDQKISLVASHLHFGIPLSKCICHDYNKTSKMIKMHSWLGRMTFFILGRMEESGSVSAQSLEILTGYVNKMNSALQELRSSLQMFWILAYVNPFIMVYISKMLKGWFGSESITGGVEMSYLSFNTLSTSPEFLGLINITIVLSSMILGLIMNKIVSFNMAYTTNLVIISAITFIAIWAEPYYPINL